MYKRPVCVKLHGVLLVTLSAHSRNENIAVADMSFGRSGSRNVAVGRISVKPQLSTTNSQSTFEFNSVHNGTNCTHSRKSAQFVSFTYLQITIYCPHAHPTSYKQSQILVSLLKV